MIWLVQMNLGAHQDYVVGIKQGCEERGDRFIGFRAVPFSGEVPEVRGKPPYVVYGSVDVVHTIHNDGRYQPGVFFNDNFKYSKYIEKLGEKVLNYDHIQTTLCDIRDSITEYADRFAEEGHIFIRPNEDLKEFVGEVVKVEELTDWIDKIDRKRTLLSPTVQAIIARPYTLNKEWRVFIVDDQVISVSRYKKDGKLDQSRGDIPQELLQFVYDTMTQWVPHPVSVMDICETGGGYYVVEFNCFNSSGFYKNNIPLITRKISEWVEKQHG